MFLKPGCPCEPPGHLPQHGCAFRWSKAVPEHLTRAHVVPLPRLCLRLCAEHFSQKVSTTQCCTPHLSFLLALACKFQEGEDLVCFVPYYIISTWHTTGAHDCFTGGRKGEVIAIQAKNKAEVIILISSKAKRKVTLSGTKVYFAFIKKRGAWGITVQNFGSRIVCYQLI